MIFGDLERFIYTFLDGNRRDDNHKLGKTIVFVKFIDRAQVDIGFACAGFHFNIKIIVAFCQSLTLLEAIAQLNVLQILQDGFFIQVKAVADAVFSRHKTGLQGRAG